MLLIRFSLLVYFVSLLITSSNKNINHTISVLLWTWMNREILRKCCINAEWDAHHGCIGSSERMSVEHAVACQALARRLAKGFSVIGGRNRCKITVHRIFKQWNSCRRLGSILTLEKKLFRALPNGNEETQSVNR